MANRLILGHSSFIDSNCIFFSMYLITSLLIESSSRSSKLQLPKKTLTDSIVSTLETYASLATFIVTFRMKIVYEFCLDVRACVLVLCLVSFAFIDAAAFVVYRFRCMCSVNTVHISSVNSEQIFRRIFSLFPSHSLSSYLKYIFSGAFLFMHKMCGLHTDNCCRIDDRYMCVYCTCARFSFSGI